MELSLIFVFVSTRKCQCAYRLYAYIATSRQAAHVYWIRSEQIDAQQDNVHGVRSIKRRMARSAMAMSKYIVRPIQRAFYYTNLYFKGKTKYYGMDSPHLTRTETLLPELLARIGFYKANSGKRRQIPHTKSFVNGVMDVSNHFALPERAKAVSASESDMEKQSRSDRTQKGRFLMGENSFRATIS